jgi:hypothetical protein
MLSHELTKGRAHHDTPGTATAAHGSPSLSLCCPSRSIEHRRRGRVDRARGGKLLRGPCMWHRNRIDGSCRWCALCSSTTAPGCTMTDPVSLSLLNRRQRLFVTHPLSAPCTVSSQMSLKPHAKCRNTSTIVGETTVQRSTPNRLCLCTLSKRNHARCNRLYEHTCALRVRALLCETGRCPLSTASLPRTQPHTNDRTLRSLTPFFATNCVGS